MSPLTSKTIYQNFTSLFTTLLSKSQRYDPHGALAQTIALMMFVHEFYYD
jgi:hypothetical protein